MKNINELRLLLYKSIIENGLNHSKTIKLGKKMDKLIVKDIKKYSKSGM